MTEASKIDKVLNCTLLGHPQKIGLGVPALFSGSKRFSVDSKSFCGDRSRKIDRTLVSAFIKSESDRGKKYSTRHKTCLNFCCDGYTTRNLPSYSLKHRNERSDMTTETSPHSWEPFGFVPDATQDSAILAELGFVPGLREMLAIRQVHALEHATVWVLSESGPGYGSQESGSTPPDNESLGGMSTDTGFYLYGPVKTGELRRAVQTALSRLKNGQWDLAVHPRCGTNLSVAMLLGVGLTLGFNQLLPKSPLEQLMGLGLAAATASGIAPDLGLVVQRYVTTAIPFNLELEEIRPTRDMWGRSAHFVRVGWIDAP